MLIRAIEGARSAPSYPELAGRRVLITGLTSTAASTSPAPSRSTSAG